MKPAGVVVALGIAAVAAALRFPDLAARPMHADEAVLADKFGTLLELGAYKWDRPALAYCTLPVAWLAGKRTYVSLDETTLRAVPAAFGLLLAMAPLLLAGALDRAALLAAALLGALSPAMVYYSRYYLPETLLAGFTALAIACGWQYARTLRGFWAVLAGACAGLMYATKETAVIALGAMALALVLTLGAKLRAIRPLHAAMALVAAASVAALFLPPLDSARAFTQTYFPRAFRDPLHLHSFGYYLHLLFSKEAFIAVLAVVGAVRGPRFARFLSWYALVLWGVYSAIPYKTPWCLLTPLHALILAAGAGAVWLWRLPRTQRARFAVGVFLAAGSANLAWQAWQASRIHSSDPRNPYVYAHTTPDVFQIRDRLEQLARAHPDGRRMPVDIVTKQNFWPLPWYLRSFPNVRWWREAPGGGAAAPVILASPDMDEALARELYEKRPPGTRELYMNLFAGRIELRPAVEVRGYVAKSLWERLER